MQLCHGRDRWAWTDGLCLPQGREGYSTCEHALQSAHVETSRESYDLLRRPELFREPLLVRCGSCTDGGYMRVRYRDVRTRCVDILQVCVQIEKWARLHRHPQLRKWSCVDTTTGEELEECASCLSARMHGAKSLPSWTWKGDTARHSLQSPNGKHTRLAPRLAANAQLNNTRSHVRAKAYLLPHVRQLGKYHGTAPYCQWYMHVSYEQSTAQPDSPPRHNNQRAASCRLQCLRARGACTIVYVAQNAIPSPSTAGQPSQNIQ